MAVAEKAPWKSRESVIYKGDRVWCVLEKDGKKLHWSCRPQHYNWVDSWNFPQNIITRNTTLEWNTVPERHKNTTEPVLWLCKEGDGMQQGSCTGIWISSSVSTDTPSILQRNISLQCPKSIQSNRLSELRVFHQTRAQLPDDQSTCLKARMNSAREDCTTMFLQQQMDLKFLQGIQILQNGW